MADLFIMSAMFVLWLVGLLTTGTCTILYIVGDKTTRSDTRYGFIAGGMAITFALVLTNGYL